MSLWWILHLCALAKDDAQPIPPAFIDSHQSPIDFRRQVVQHGVGRRVDVQGRRRQEQQPIRPGKVPARESSRTLELPTNVMPLHAGPVIESL